MKKILLCCLLFALLSPARSQRVYFMYLQSENATPFYVRMGDKIHSSAAAGYLILSNLADSTYTIMAGFPNQQGNELRFTVPLNGKDRGLLLRRVDDSWVLFDWQTMAMIRQQTEATSSGPVSYKSDPFSKTLSLAADDPSLLVVRAEVPKPAAQKPADRPAITPDLSSTDTKDVADVLPDTTAVAKVGMDNNARTGGSGTALVKDSVVAQTPPPVQDTASVRVTARTNDATTASPDTVAVVATQQSQADTTQQTTTRAETPVLSTAPAVDTATVTTAAPAATFVRSTITRRSESSTTEGFGLVFLDETSVGIDTIRLLIPTPRMPFRLQESAPVETAAPENAGQSNGNAEASRSQAAANCRSTAGEGDFRRLRRDMAAKNTDEGMLEEARRSFRSRCFSVEQVRNLSALFLNDGGKYKFFDLAWEHVSDRGQFMDLQAQLSDPYYVNRFKALVGDQ